MPISSSQLDGLVLACRMRPRNKDFTTHGKAGQDAWIFLTPDRIVSVRLRGDQAQGPMLYAWRAACRPRAADQMLLTDTAQDGVVIIEFYPSHKLEGKP